MPGGRVGVGGPLGILGCKVGLLGGGGLRGLAGVGKVPAWLKTLGRVRVGNPREAAMSPLSREEAISARRRAAAAAGCGAADEANAAAAPLTLASA